MGEAGVTKKAKLAARVDTVEHFFLDVLGLRFFAEGVVKCNYTPGSSKLVLVTGENATGKSFLRRVVGAALSEHSIESIALSMQKRAGGIDRMFNAFIWGDEATHATGSLSSNAILGAINTSRGRNQRHAIVWDEPDVGLSDNYAAGAADEIAEFVADPPPHLFFAVVTTHRTAMLRRLAKQSPHHLRLGDDKSLTQVLSSRVVPKRLKELLDHDHQMFRSIGKAFGL